MRRSLLHSRRLRCFFEADSRTPFRHSPLREETAFREKPHFPAREALLPCFFCHPAEIPRLRFGRLPCLRPIAVPPQRNPLHTESHASDTMFSQADRLSSRNTAASGSKNRASKPCIETVQEKTRKRGVSPTPLFPAPLRSPPCPMDSDRRRPGPGQKRSLAKYRKARFSGFPTNRLRPQSLRSRALSAGASDEHRRGNGRKESKEGFPCEKIGKPTDHPSPNLPTNVCDFELPQSRIPPTAGVPMRTEQETIGQGPPTKYR